MAQPTAILDALRIALQRDNGSDGFTAQELADAIPCGAEAARKALRRMIQDGAVKPGRAYRPAIDGFARPVPVYMLVNGKKRR